jgi:hypothetical protein
LRKFHFGLADRCNAWYVLNHTLIYDSRFSDSPNWVPPIATSAFIRLGK